MMKIIAAKCTAGVSGGTLATAVASIAGWSVGLQITGFAIGVLVGLASFVSFILDIRRKWKDRNK